MFCPFLLKKNSNLIFSVRITLNLLKLESYLIYRAHAGNEKFWKTSNLKKQVFIDKVCLSKPRYIVGLSLNETLSE